MNTPLLDMLGAQWDLQAPIVAVRWADNDNAAYAMGDGRVALTTAHGLAGPQAEMRPDGGISLTPSTAKPNRPVMLTCHTGSCRTLAADGAGGFVSGGDDGRVMRVRADTSLEEVAHVPGTWIDAVACNRDGTVAYAGGRQVARRSSAGRDEIELPTQATSLAFSPDGATLAIAHNGGVTLWGALSLPRQLNCAGYHRSVAWSPDGTLLFTGMQENAVHGWRVADGSDFELTGYVSQPLSLAFTHDGSQLITSGALRPACWELKEIGSADSPSECGVPNKTPVNCVACHPRRQVIAVGHQSGAITLCAPGSDGFLLIKGAGGGALSSLAWSPNGQRLAFGTQDGTLGWLTLPDALFRSEGGSPAPTHTDKQEARYEQ